MYNKCSAVVLLVCASFSVYAAELQDLIGTWTGTFDRKLEGRGTVEIEFWQEGTDSNGEAMIKGLSYYNSMDCIGRIEGGKVPNPSEYFGKKYAILEVFDKQCGSFTSYSHITINEINGKAQVDLDWSNIVFSEVIGRVSLEPSSPSQKMKEVKAIFLNKIAVAEARINKANEAANAARDSRATPPGSIDDYYSGSWKATLNGKSVELLIWRLGKGSRFKREGEEAFDLWNGLVFFPETGCVFGTESDNSARYLKTTLNTIVKTFYSNVNKGTDCSVMSDGSRLSHGSFSMTPNNVDTFSLRKSSMGVSSPFDSVLIDDKDILEFKRTVISSEFNQRVARITQEMKTRHWEEYELYILDWMLPNTVAVQRSRDPRYEITEAEINYASAVLDRENFLKDAKINRKISELTLPQVKSNEQVCKPFTSDLSTIIPARLSGRQDAKYFYFYMKDAGVRIYYSDNGKIRGPSLPGLSLDMSRDDEKKSRFLCDNELQKNTSGAEPVCPFCFYPAGAYIDTIFHGDLERNFDLDMKYMEYHSPSNRSDHEVVLNQLVSNGKALTLLDEVVGFYMYQYSDSYPSCFAPGAFERTKITNFSGFRITDGLGFEITKVDPQSVKTRYHLNKEFAESCDHVCNKHGMIFAKANSGALSGNNRIAAQGRTLVLDVFKSITMLMSDYDCNSAVRKQFEKNLLELHKPELGHGEH